MATVADFTGMAPAWCPGCGNFGILMAVKRALVELGLEPYQVLLASDIGQAGKLPHYTRGNIFNSLHGRALPPALGAKMANRDLKVFVFSGDGGAYGEGTNHFVHAVRRNHDVVYVVHDNQVYGLTRGQTAPTSEKGYVTKTTPQGAPPPLNPLAVALIMGAGFVARGYAGDVDHLVGLLKEAAQYKGFALVDILQPCVSFNHVNTFQWYRQRVYKLGAEYNIADLNAAMLKAAEWDDKIPVGILHKVQKPVYEDSFNALTGGALSGAALVDQPIDPKKVEVLFTEFM
jgi:2-oxoglutarate ferredoxin oxidoreductase subunit beta